MKLKKVISICLAAVMTFSLAACGDGSAASGKNGSVPTYTQLDLSKYSDTKATIKFIHHKIISFLFH